MDKLNDTTIKQAGEKKSAKKLREEIVRKKTWKKICIWYKNKENDWSFKKDSLSDTLLRVSKGSLNLHNSYSLIDFLQEVVRSINKYLLTYEYTQKNHLEYSTQTSKYRLSMLSNYSE